jgi:ABC-type branched-subunit amino acid transport system substrate-binding protein
MYWFCQIMKRTIASSLVLLMISLLAAACSASPAPCSDPLGCVEIPPESPLVIGALLANTGDYLSAGMEALAGIESALEKKGDLLGHPIQLIHTGTDCTAESARLAAVKFALVADLTAVIAPTCSAEFTLAGSILADAGIPLVEPIFTSPSTARELTDQVLSALEQVALQGADGSISIPRQALFEVISPSP